MPTCRLSSAVHVLVYDVSVFAHCKRVSEWVRESSSFSHVHSSRTSRARASRKSLSFSPPLFTKQTNQTSVDGVDTLGHDGGRRVYARVRFTP